MTNYDIDKHVARSSSEDDDPIRRHSLHRRSFVASQTEHWWKQVNVRTMHVSPGERE